MPRPSARADRVSLWRVMGWAIAHALINQRERFTGAAAASRSRPPAAGRNRDSGKSSSSVHGRGRDADSPGEIPTRGWKDIAWRVYDEIGKDRVLAVAAGVTFYALLAIFPAISAFISLYGLVADPEIINEHLAALSGVLPGGALEIVGEQVKRITSQPSGTLGVSFFISLAVALWSANAGMKAIFDALNVAYNEREKRSFFQLNIQSLLFTFGTMAVLVAALLAIVAVPVAMNYLGLGRATEWIISIGRWPLILIGVVLLLALLYRYGPSRDPAEWRWLTPGALLAAGVWLTASMLFSWYAANFGSFNETYGSLGAAIGFMIWIWISAIIILVGAELNAEAEHQTARDSTEGSPQPMGSRGAAVADSLGEART